MINVKSLNENFSFKYYKDKDIVIDTDINDHSILLNDDTMVDVETRSLKNIPPLQQYFLQHKYYHRYRP